MKRAIYCNTTKKTREDIDNIQNVIASKRK